MVVRPVAISSGMIPTILAVHWIRDVLAVAAVPLVVLSSRGRRSRLRSGLAAMVTTIAAGDGWDDRQQDHNVVFLFCDY